MAYAVTNAAKNLTAAQVSAIAQTAWRRGVKVGLKIGRHRIDAEDFFGFWAFVQQWAWRENELGSAAHCWAMMSVDRHLWNRTGESLQAHMQDRGW